MNYSLLTLRFWCEAKEPLKGDSKSIFALLLRLEREIGSETKVALPFSTNERMKGEPQETAHHDGRSQPHPSAAAILGQETITPGKTILAVRHAKKPGEV